MTAQASFRTALMDPAASAPAELTDPWGRPAGRRFSVYRNNVAVSLTEALEATFPVLRALVGAEFFTAMAGIFLRAHPPASPVLAAYGDAMPGFLESFAPVAELPYLPDVARLELALCASYHAADAAPLPADRLAGVDPLGFLSARLTLAPALRLIASDWPIVSIWRANAEDGPAPAMTPETALITRPGFDPRIHLLPAGADIFIAALNAGQPLGAAAEAAPDGFDLGAALGLLLAEGALTGLVTEATP